MKLAARTTYAVRLMLELHRLGGADAPVRLSEVARVTGISRGFLEQLAVELRNHSLLRAVSGRNGGYSLACPPGEISVRDVITAVSGPISLAACVDMPEICVYAGECECRLLWVLLQDRIATVLEEYKLTDLARKETMDAIRKEMELADTVCRVRGDGRAGAVPVGAGAPACARFGSGHPLGESAGACGPAMRCAQAALRER